MKVWAWIKAWWVALVVLGVAVVYAARGKWASVAGVAVAWVGGVLLGYALHRFGAWVSLLPDGRFKRAWAWLERRWSMVACGAILICYVALGMWWWLAGTVAASALVVTAVYLSLRVDRWLSRRRFRSAREFLSGSVRDDALVQEAGAVLDEAYAGWWATGRAAYWEPALRSSWVAYIRAMSQAYTTREAVVLRARPQGVYLDELPAAMETHLGRTVQPAVPRVFEAALRTEVDRMVRVVHGKRGTLYLHAAAPEPSKERLGEVASIGTVVGKKRRRRKNETT